MMHQHNFPAAPTDELSAGLKAIREAAVDASEKLDQAIAVYHSLRKYLIEFEEQVRAGWITSPTVSEYFKGEFQQMAVLLGLQYDLLKAMAPKLERAEEAEGLLPRSLSALDPTVISRPG